MENYIIEIQSYSDIITNSSTEIYNTDSNKNLIKTLEELGIDYIVPRSITDLLNIIKGTVEKKFKDHNFLNAVEIGINRTGRNGKNEYLPKLTYWGYKRLLELGYSEEKISEFFDPIYKECGVYGKVYITYYNMCNLSDKFGVHKRTARKFKSLGLD